MLHKRNKFHKLLSRLMVGMAWNEGGRLVYHWIVAGTTGGPGVRRYGQANRVRDLTAYLVKSTGTSSLSGRSSLCHLSGIC